MASQEWEKPKAVVIPKETGNLAKGKYGPIFRMRRRRHVAFVYKGEMVDHLNSAITAVLAGQRYFSPLACEAPI
jgi:hypothetical protein